MQSKCYRIHNRFFIIYGIELLAVPAIFILLFELYIINIIVVLVLVSFHIYSIYYVYKTDDMLRIENKQIFIKHAFRKTKVINIEEYKDFFIKKKQIPGIYATNIETGKRKYICTLGFEAKPETILHDIMN